ncbi:DUF5999 family protein [Streptomyces sp. NPDC058439]|uniref:DUF5999 family protein n=1 Tax=Streptomyces sp. NPDC058439 TaxID=3346500 RepID=UPI0036674D8F
MSLSGLVRTGFSRRAPAQPSPLPGRSVVAAAMETIALVLDAVVVPTTGQDAHDLMSRLRDHHRQLGEGTIEAAPASASSRVTVALRMSGELIASPVPGDLLRARAHLQNTATAVKELLTAMSAAGLVCVHQPECPPAAAPGFQNARVLFCCLETGYSRLCNGAVLFEDTGHLKPNGKVSPPRRPLPRIDGEVPSA